MSGPATSKRSEEGFRYYLEQNGIKLKWHLSRKEDYLESCRYYLGFYDTLYRKYLPENKDAEILEVGCAYGWFLYYLRQKGYTNFTGIDLSREKIDIINKYGAKKAEVADVFRFLRDKKETYDLVVLTYVLEHIQKSRIIELLTLVRKSLSMEGKLIVTVPNMELPFSLRLRYLDFTHEVGFVKESLLHVLYQAGYDDIKVHGILRTPRNLFGKLSYRIAKGLLSLFCRALCVQPPWLFTEGIIGIGTKKSKI